MSPRLERLLRRFIRWRLAKVSADDLLRSGERRLIKAFKRAANQSYAYQTLLTEAGISVSSIQTVQDFIQRCPVLEKHNTFRRFSTAKLLARDIGHDNLASVLTSSGHGAGGYAIGVSTRAQLDLSPHIIDMGLDMAFEIDRHRTLLINCLPMGVTFQSAVCCVANVSVREDMACALVNQVGGLFEQIILCGDPLFLKRLCDYSQKVGVNWSQHRVHVILGEETFSETFRNYLGGVLGNSPDKGDSGLIGSSMGVGELGLNLFNETRETIALRRACARDPQLLAALVGADVVAKGMLPTFLVYNPMRTFIEIDQPNADGIGDLLVSTLDIGVPIPLLRYKTGDRMKSLSKAEQAKAEATTEGAFKASALPVVALFGRNKDYLSESLHVDHFKTAMYAIPELAVQCSGAFRLEQMVGEGIHWHVQMARDASGFPEALAEGLKKALNYTQSKEMWVTCYPFQDFPFGLTLDYERKFVYWPGN